MLELKDVSLSFGRLRALDRVSLAIEPERTTVLIGQSGSGKSTLLRLLIGLVRPDTGTVTWDGASIATADLLQWRRRMGYVIQDGGLFPHLTARENAGLLMSHLGRPRTEIEARIAELTTLTQFPREALDRYPVQLSGGQRQRVSLIRALMLDPGVLLLDEPLGALDPMIRSDLQTDLKGIFHKLKKTVVLVTHDMAEAAYFADTIVLMNEGRIVQKGSYRDLVTTPAEPFVTAFLSAQRKLVGVEESRA